MQLHPAAAESREAIGQNPNPLGMAGIEFVEFATLRPQALGHALEAMGFRPVARHRSREVMLYRQGGMNVVVNAHAAAPTDGVPLTDTPRIAAVALRVRDAGAAWRRSLDLGAWAVPAVVGPMELNIPAIHGVGSSRLYFVDRWNEYSIFDVDFIPIPTVDPAPPALAGLHWFGLVQYIGPGRTADWCTFYAELLGCEVLPDEVRFGILPRGRILRSPCGLFHLQLIEPEPGVEDPVAGECLQRLGLGTNDVPGAMRSLVARGVAFVETPTLHSSRRGALTDSGQAGVSFELVHADDGGPKVSA